MTFNRKAASLLAALTLSGSAALIAPSIVGAQTDEAPVAEAPAAEAPAAEAPVAGVGEDVDADAAPAPSVELEVDVDVDGWEPTPEELAELNAEADKLIEKLREAGIPVERAVEDGFVFPEFTEDLTEEQWETVDSIFEEAFGAVEFDGDDGDFDIDVDFDFDLEDLTDEEIAMSNEETAKLVEALRDAGIDVDVHREENGLDCIDFGDEGPSEEQMEAIDRVFEELYGEFDFDAEFELEFDEGDLEDADPAEDIEESNVDA